MAKWTDDDEQELQDKERDYMELKKRKDDLRETIRVKLIEQGIIGHTPQAHTFAKIMVDNAPKIVKILGEL